MAQVKNVKCEVCSKDFPGAMILGNHQKKDHPDFYAKKQAEKQLAKENGTNTPVEPTPLENEPVLSSVETPVTNVPANTEGPVAVDTLKERFIEAMKSYCRGSLADVEKKALFDRIVSRPFVEVILMPIPGERNAQHEWGINGLLFVCPKGKRVLIPEDTYEEYLALNNVTTFDKYKITPDNPNGKETQVR